MVKDSGTGVKERILVKDTGTGIEHTSKGY